MANWYIKTSGDSSHSQSDRYYFDSTMTINSINAAGTSANITASIRVQANWGGYGSYWNCYNRVVLLNGSTTLKDQIIYTSGMGNANQVTSTWYWYVVTHNANGTSAGNTANPYSSTLGNGYFFTWTGDVALSNGKATIYLQHEFQKNGNSSYYLPVNTALTTRHTLNISAYKVTYNANGGSPTPTAIFLKPGAAIGTLPTCSHGNTTATAGTRTVTFNPNGGSVSPTSATSTATTTTTYTLKGWFTATSGGTQVSATTVPTGDVTYYAQWNTSSSTGAYSAVSLPTPTQTNYRCTGWYTGTSGGTLRGAAGGSYTPSASETIYAQWIEVHKLDVNGLLDGTSAGNTTNYGTFDVYIGGTKKATGVADFYQDVDKGTSYEIKNITATSGKKYIRVTEGSLTGTMGSSNIGVRLEFRTLNAWVNVNGTWKHGVIWVNNNGTWKPANAHINASGTWKQGK